MYKDIYNSFIHDILKLAATQMSINSTIDKSIVVDWHNGILYIHESRQSTAPPNNINESYKLLMSKRNQRQKNV